MTSGVLCKDKMESFEYTPLNQSRPGIAQAQLERSTTVATSLNSSVSAVQQMQGRLAPHQMTPPSTLQHHSASQQIQGHLTLQQMATTPVLQQRSTPLVLQGLLSEPVAGEEGLQSSSVPPALPAASFTARLFDLDSSDESDTTPIATPSAEVASTRPEDRYDTMKADEIRKECTRRGLKQDVRAAYAATYDEDHPVNTVIFTHEYFVGVKPSAVKKHSAKKLYEKWKEVNRYYIISKKKLTQSGQHEKDFPRFVDGRGFVLYLRYWLDIILDSQTGSNSKRKDAQRLESLATSFAAYVNDRRLEVERVASSTTMKMQEKGSFLSMLSDIRRQLSDIDRDLSAAKGASIERLKEDQEVLLHERQSLINKLPSYD
ncbi:uncharacterized protein PITG_14718 [Phytophthora infestans T30-4]|uniref:Uncharacterized protein n=1 Tax=Phytophthora infestans (strain T30-4) TaxID=403677 RepID=D0NQX6_PHYIT|nr:uncharacterized protein PITG_14718 [Phytophthora infestans T30-4]EEY63074.1 hypothetical protein PITG_14718 [Phytophthora infestans T30-4]|eukprot:XP_002898597.1 hypothetical protein PITG_14718 [Phytophthora infestans T30-4]